MLVFAPLQTHRVGKWQIMIHVNAHIALAKRIPIFIGDYTHSTAAAMPSDQNPPRTVGAALKFTAIRNRHRMSITVIKYAIFI